MRKVLQIALLVVLETLTMNSFAATTAGAKLAYVSVEKIIQSSPQAAEVGKKLQKEFAARGAELESISKQLNDRAAALEKEAATLSESDRKNKEQDLSNSNLDFQRKQRELAEDVDLRKKQELASLQELINKAIQTVSKKEGYDLVLYGNIAYVGKSVDITDKVIKTLGHK